MEYWAPWRGLVKQVIGAKSKSALLREFAEFI